MSFMNYSGKLTLSPPSVAPSDLPTSGTFEGQVLLPLGTSWTPGSLLPAGTSPAGRGIMWFDDGTSYDGLWANGTFNGTGTRRTATKEYTGEFSNGNITGKGYMNYKQNGEYTGWFRNGHREGRGKMKWASGRTYDGQWVADKPDGYGKMTWPNGDWWECYWRGTLRNTLDGKGQRGLGRARWHDEDYPEYLYVGGTKDGLRHGSGILYKLEHKYEGNFTDGRLDGRIKVTNLKTKKVTYRRYEDGQLADD